MTVPAEDEPTETMDPQPSPTRRRRWHVLLVFPAILLVAAAVLLDLDYMGLGPVWFHRAVIDGPAKKNFVLDTFLLCCLLGFFVFLLGRFWIPAAVFSVAGVALAFAHGIKIDVRREPIFPSDLAIAGQGGFLKDMVDGATLVKAGVAIGAIVVAALLLGLVLRKRLPRVRRSTDPAFWRTLLVFRVIGVLLTGAILLDASYFNTPGNLVRRAYDHVGSHWISWDQERNYRRNGFVGGFLYNLHGPVMKEPKGYSKAAVEDVVRRYTALAKKTNATRDPHALDGVNVVSVLSEAFSDPTRLKGIHLAADPIPNTRRLMSQTYSGTMLAQLIGGGTANMEFEVLTGLSMAQFAPQMTTPYQMLLPHFREFPGAVRYFESQGHRALAVHPYSTRMYKRTIAYPVLGFQRFVYNATMHEKQRVPGGTFIDDASAFDEVNTQIATSSQPLFLNLVTMQNHYPWNKEFRQPWPQTGLTGLHQQLASRYSRGINYTDGELKDWLAQLSKTGEKTAVIFYGDHLPGAYPPRINRLNTDATMHSTPFFIWTNFKKLPHTPVPLTSPIYFLPTLFNLLDAPVPPMYALLDRLHAQIPAMEQGKMFGPNGQRLHPKQLSPQARAVLRDYRLIQYDLAAGKQYSKKALYTLP